MKNGGRKGPNHATFDLRNGYAGDAKDCARPMPTIKNARLS